MPVLDLSSLHVETQYLGCILEQLWKIAVLVGDRACQSCKMKEVSGIHLFFYAILLTGIFYCAALPRLSRDMLFWPRLPKQIELNPFLSVIALSFFSVTYCILSIPMGVFSKETDVLLQINCSFFR